MRVFISWAGDKSRKAARALFTWLPLVINAIEPFMSEKIDPGGRGLDEIADALAGSRFGIICLTRENWERPWVNFEAGALSKEVGKTRVVPLLVDLEHLDASGPLAQFQWIKPFEGDVKRLIETINRITDKPLREGQLDIAFDTLWPRLDRDLAPLRVSSSTAPARDVGSMVAEVSGILRNEHRRGGSFVARPGIHFKHVGLNSVARRAFKIGLEDEARGLGCEVYEDGQDAARGLYVLASDAARLMTLMTRIPALLEKAKLSASETEFRFIRGG
jgi:hypothetical protein